MMKADASFVCCAVVVALLLPSCGKGPGEAGSGRVRTETVDGLTLVHNPQVDAAPGKFAGGKMYRFKEDEATGLRVLTRYRIVWESGRKSAS